VKVLEDEYLRAETELADPSIHADQAAARKLGKRHAELRPIIEAYRKWLGVVADIEAAKELSADDSSFAEEVERLQQDETELVDKLNDLLLPRDPLDGSDVILEIKAGEGGDESALFAGDLMRMYLRWAETRGWKTQIIEAEESDLVATKTYPFR
jgi:peptide chain release factor 1